MSAFTGYALTTKNEYALYDTASGRFIGGRRWSSAGNAEEFRLGLRPTLRDRLVVLPKRDLVLTEYDEGKEIE